MAETCVWEYCEDEKEGDNAVIVQFSNGNLKSTQQVDFTMYKNIDESNPRKKTRRILAAETERLSYVGYNFGTGSMKCNSLCKYYIGVLDKKSGRMEVHNAQLFNMQPVIPGESTAEDESLPSTSKTYREKVDSLIEAFGTNKQKRALSSRRLNQVGSDTLQQAVTRAANTIIDQKGLEALEQDVSEAKAQSEAVLYLPPCHADAEKPEDVYLFDDLLSTVEYEALEAPSQKFMELSSEDLQKMAEDGSPLSVVRLLQALPEASKIRERKVRCLWYISQLIKLAHKKSITRKFGLEDECPRIIQNKLMKTFTVETYNSGRVQNMVPTSMKLKLAAYCLALLLHVDDMTANLTLLHRDLGISERKMLDLARSMGLRVSKPPVMEDGAVTLGDGHRLATLELPLPKYESAMQGKKRKKMK